MDQGLLDGMLPTGEQGLVTGSDRVEGLLSGMFPTVWNGAGAMTGGTGTIWKGSLTTVIIRRTVRIMSLEFLRVLWAELDDDWVIQKSIQQGRYEIEEGDELLAEGD